MTAVEMQKVVVFRRPVDQGNYRFWLAEVSLDAARRLEDRLLRQEASVVGVESELRLGDGLTLPQVMEKLKDRDFQVVDFPAGN